MTQFEFAVRRRYHLDFCTGSSQAHWLGVRHTFASVETVTAQVARIGNAQLDVCQVGLQGFLRHHLHLHARRQRSNAEKRSALRFAGVRQSLQWRVGDANARIKSVHLHIAKLRVLHLFPLLEDAPSVVVLVELRQRRCVLAGEFLVVLDKRFLALDAELLEQIP